MEAIDLNDVTKRFKKSVVLDNVNLRIEQGDILGVIGQSGSGKSTLLNLITGFIEPTNGEITYFSEVQRDGEDLNKNLNKIKRFIGFTPQHNSFYPKLTVMENMMHFGRMYGIKKEILRETTENLLKFTRLSHHKNKLAEHLSGGMQKRLDISCSLIHKPRVLVLDEPTADLDPILQEEILHLLKEVNKQGLTIIIASHHLDSIEKICNKVAIVHNKTVFKHGKIKDIRKKESLNKVFEKIVRTY